MQWVWLTQIVALGCGFILFGNIMTPLEWRCFLLQESNDFPWRGFKAFEVNLIAEDKHEITHILMTWWQLTSWSYIWSSRTSLAAFLGWFICTCWSRLSTGLGKEKWCSIGFPGFIFCKCWWLFGGFLKDKLWWKVQSCRSFIAHTIWGSKNPEKMVSSSNYFMFFFLSS